MVNKVAIFHFTLKKRILETMPSRMLILVLYSPTSSYPRVQTMWIELTYVPNFTWLFTRLTPGSPRLPGFPLTRTPDPIQLVMSRFPRAQPNCRLPKTLFHSFAKLGSIIFLSFFYQSSQTRTRIPKSFFFIYFN